MPLFSHPSSVNMTYCQHALFSCSLSLTFLCASFQAFVHAIWPDVWVNSTTNTVRYARNKLDKAQLNIPLDPAILEQL